MYDWEGGEYMLCMIGKEEENTCCVYDREEEEYMLCMIGKEENTCCV